MQAELIKLLPVLVGAAIGIAGTVSSTLLTSWLAERRSRRELAERYLELVGKREALADFRGYAGPPGTTPVATKALSWLKDSTPSSAEIAREIGYLAASNEVSESLHAKSESLQDEAERLTEERDRLQKENERLRKEPDAQAAGIEKK